MIAQNFIGVARIIKPRGNKGALVVRSYYHDPERLFHLKRVWLKIPGNSEADVKEFQIRSIHHHSDIYYCFFEGISTIDAAEKLRGADMLVPVTEAVSLASDEWYHHDLLECRVIDQRGNAYGTVQNIIETGSNDVLECLRDTREFLVPFTKEVIVEVDITRRLIIINPIPGLFEIDEN